MPNESTWAQEPTADPGPATGRVADCDPGLFLQSGLARFKLQAGRLVLDPVRFRKGSEERTCNGRTETMRIASLQGVPSIQYTCDDSFQRVRLVAEHGRSLRIESRLHATGEVGVLAQAYGKPIRWSVTRSVAADRSLDQEIEGATLLHIIGQDESGYQLHLEPLITRMLQGRSLLRLARRTRDYMSDNVASLPRVERERIESLILQLRHPSVASRRVASRELSRLGTSVVPMLAYALTRDDLDAEQRTRIRWIIRKFDRFDEDTPSSLACLLAADREHWAIIANRIDEQNWVAVNQHFRQCGLPLLSR